MEDSEPILPHETGIPHKAYLDLSLFHKKEAPQIIAEAVAADSFIEYSKGIAECPDFSISGRVQKISCTYGVPQNCYFTRNFKVKNRLIGEKIPYHWYYDSSNNKWLGLLVEKKYKEKFSTTLNWEFFSEPSYNKGASKKKKRNKNKKDKQKRQALEKNRQFCSNKKKKKKKKFGGGGGYTFKSDPTPKSGASKSLSNKLRSNKARISQNGYGG